MKLFLLILGIVVIGLNVFLWYSKKRSDAEENDTSKEKTDGIKGDSTKFLNSPEANGLKQAAAAELGIPVEQLNRMSAEEIADLAAEKGLIQSG